MIKRKIHSLLVKFGLNTFFPFSIGLSFILIFESKLKIFLEKKNLI
jgi:hypothetical protein